MTTKRSEFGSLADRTAGPAGSPAGSAASDRPQPVGVHVWVKDGAGEVAGLLAGWRQTANGWWGRVVTVSDGQPAETLIRADLLRKAE
ncbi:MAG TPA: hypothetical protein VGK17_10130 [Propionicimonas sp.]